MKYVLIIATPPGEAPQKVRESWVGLKLPIEGGGPQRLFAKGVITGPTSFWGSLLSMLFGWTKQREGYAVDAAKAVAILKEKSPEAAAWWKKHVPHLIQPGQHLLFNLEVCEAVTSNES